ncbi:hypothetical protein QBD01_004678 [Ochrobactrum sp. 19YEA23]|nr:hypothetical protein [Ochrobactrum sp. 19YEA23]
MSSIPLMNREELSLYIVLGVGGHFCLGIQLAM